MFKWKHVISFLQIVAILIAYPIFFYLAPWATSRPVSELSQEHGRPAWAKYYSVNHGSYTYYKSSPREEQIRTLLLGGTLAGCLGFMLWSAFLYTSPEELHRLKNGRAPETGVKK